MYARFKPLRETAEMVAIKQTPDKQLSFVDPTQLALRAVAIALILKPVYEMVPSRVLKYSQIKAMQDMMGFAETLSDTAFWGYVGIEYSIRIQQARRVLTVIDKDIQGQGWVLVKRLAEGYDTIPLLFEWLKGDKDNYLLAKLRL